MRSLLPLHLACFGLGCLVVGCSVYDPSLVQEGEADAGPTDCDPMVPPPRPEGPDDGEDVGTVGFALKDVVFDQGGERWRTIGFDLDGRCTEPPAYDTECVPPNESASPEVDGEGGIDNAFGHQLFPTVDLAIPGLEEVSRGYQEDGIGAVIILVDGWNGEPDDSRVDVTAAITVFGAPSDEGDMPEITIGPDGEPQLPDGSAAPPPNWDGDDFFWARDDNFFDGNVDRPLIRDDNAYVAGHRVVVTLPERTDFIFPGMDIGLLVRLTGAVATATLTAGGEEIEKVTVAGRWSVLDMLDTAEALGVCRDMTEYMILSNQLDRVADLRSRPGSGGPGVQCDAISIGLEFASGARARLGRRLGCPTRCLCTRLVGRCLGSDRGRRLMLLRCLRHPSDPDKTEERDRSQNPCGKELADPRLRNAVQIVHFVLPPDVTRH